MLYEDIVRENERYLNGIPYMWFRRESARTGILLVTFATFRNGDKYASLEACVRHTGHDLLCLRDPDNTYYLRDDLGAGYRHVLDHVLAEYNPSRVVMFGSSMAGYAALRWALELDTNCIVNNPQLNLDISARLSWKELRESILRIPHRFNLEDLHFQERHCAVTCLHSRHPMDQANIELLFRMWLRTPGMSLYVQQHREENHRYLIRSFPEFIRLIDVTLEARAEGIQFQRPL